MSGMILILIDNSHFYPETSDVNFKFNYLKPKQMNGQYRKDIYPGLEVDIILKKDQRSGARTRGIVQAILTSSAFHSRGIKVRLEDGQVGRVAGSSPV